MPGKIGKNAWQRGANVPAYQIIENRRERVIGVSPNSASPTRAKPYDELTARMPAATQTKATAADPYLLRGDNCSKLGSCLVGSYETTVAQRELDRKVSVPEEVNVML
jgi:hypothetical protein